MTKQDQSSMLATAPCERTNTLVEALRRQHAGVRELLALARTQADMISSGACDPLLALLSQRQAILASLAQSQRAVDALSRRAAEGSPADPPAGDRQIVRELIEDIEGGIREIMACDAAAERDLQRGRDDLRSEISDLESARQARAAYVATGRTNRFEDRRI